MTDRSRRGPRPPRREVTPGVRSTAAVAGHPLHPMMIVFPIAFLVGALVSDVIYWRTGEACWAQTSFWLLVGGVAMGLGAAVLGLVDFLTIERARAHMIGWLHFLGNVAAIVVALVNLLLRLGDQGAAVVPVGLILSALVAIILVFTGWFGGELAYRYGIGVVGPQP